MEPWLNVSTGCTFPAPWVNSSRVHERRNVTETTEQRPSGIDPAQERPNTQYIADYEHLAFGNFTVYLHNGSLRYIFGLLLRGQLNPSETVDKFYMSLDQPLTYRTVFYPQYPLGFPVYFVRRGGMSAEVDAVKVPYMEFSLPPVFTKVRTSSNGGLRASSESLHLFVLVILLTAFSL